MNERCPKCGAAVLAALEGSVVRSCVTCKGFWVPPAAFREPGVVPRLKERDLHPAHPLEQDHRTGVCPEGHGLLRRARASNEEPYFVERCARCGGVWFDPGEWTRLADENLLADVTSLWSPAWRGHLSEEQNRASLEADLRSRLGHEIFDLMDRLVESLSDPAQRALALAYLQQRLRDR